MTVHNPDSGRHLRLYRAYTTIAPAYRLELQLLVHLLFLGCHCGCPLIQAHTSPEVPCDSSVL